jgi:hypothetical protein
MGGGTWIEKWSTWMELCETWMAFMIGGTPMKDCITQTACAHTHKSAQGNTGTTQILFKIVFMITKSTRNQFSRHEEDCIRVPENPKGKHKQTCMCMIAERMHSQERTK